MRTSKTLYHNYLFLFGFIYYFVLPLWVVVTNSFHDYPGMDYLYKYYNDSFTVTYCIIIISFLISFMYGSLLPLKFIKRKSNVQKKEFIFGHRDLFFILIPFFLYAQIIIFINRGSLFQGYLIEYNTQFIGNIATLNTLFIFWLLYHKNTKSNTFFLYFLTFSIIEFSIVLLGLGSRMYILVPLVSYLIYLLDAKKITIRRLIINTTLAILFFLCIGIWRLGNNISIDGMLYIGFAEPCLTWISAVSMFTLNESIPLFAIPYNFLTSFINFIPSILIPNKSILIEPIALSYDSPFGATNLLLSLISNFGILGSCIFLFFMGFILTYIRINCHSLFFKTYYLCLCGILPFQFFRDGFSVTNKMLIYNFLIFPFIFILIEKTIYIKSKLIRNNENKNTSN